VLKHVRLHDNCKICLYLGIGVPYILVFGGTDLSVSSKECAALAVMDRAVKNAKWVTKCIVNCAPFNFCLCILF
jgi:hypothetical protein